MAQRQGPRFSRSFRAGFSNVMTAYLLSDFCVENPGYVNTTYVDTVNNTHWIWHKVDYFYGAKCITGVCLSVGPKMLTVEDVRVPSDDAHVRPSCNGDALLGHLYGSIIIIIIMCASLMMSDLLINYNHLQYITNRVNMSGKMLELISKIPPRLI